jgi:hypothetical protein
MTSIAGAYRESTRRTRTTRAPEHPFRLYKHDCLYISRQGSTRRASFAPFNVRMHGMGAFSPSPRDVTNERAKKLLDPEVQTYTIVEQRFILLL